MALCHIDTGNPYLTALGPPAGAGLVALAGRRRERPPPDTSQAVDIRSMTDEEIATELRVRQDVRGDELSAWYGHPR